MTRLTVNVLLILACLTPSAWAETIQAKLLGPVAIGTADATNYFFQWGGLAGNSTTEGSRQSVAPSAGTIIRMLLKLSVAPQNGAGSQTVTVTFRVAGASAGPSCTITEDETTCESDTSGTYAANDLLGILQTAANTPAAATMEVWFWIVDGTHNETIYLISTGGTALPTTGSQYQTITPGGFNATENLVQIPMPFAGTVMGFYVRLSGSPNNGGGTQTYTFTVEIGGSDSTSTCAISETATACNDVTNQPTFTAGQTITVEATVTAGTPTARIMKGGIVVANTVGGFALLSARDSENMPTGSTGYRPLNGVGGGWTATETDTDQRASQLQLLAVYVDISADPDNGADTQSYTLTVRDDASATNCSCAISDGATTCNDTCTDDVLVNSQMAVEAVPANTPTGATASWGVWAFINPRDAFLVQ